MALTPVICSISQQRKRQCQGHDCNKSVNLEQTPIHSQQRGTSLVVHAKADDMKTDPAGNAGYRIACV